MNPVDQHYLSLDCELAPLSKDSEEFAIIQKYLKNTHGHTHTQYTMEIEDVFVVNKYISLCPLLSPL